MIFPRETFLRSLAATAGRRCDNPSQVENGRFGGDKAPKKHAPTWVIFLT